MGKKFLNKWYGLQLFAVMLIVLLIPRMPLWKYLILGVLVALYGLFDRELDRENLP